MRHRTLRLHILLVALMVAAGCRGPVVRLPHATLQAAPNEPVTLPAEFVDGWIIVDATINGRGPYRLVLDTGASVSGLAPRVAEELGLSPDAEVNLVDIAGVTTRMPLYHAQEITVGPLRLSPAPIILSDLFDDAFSRLRVDGLLGYAGLDQFTLDLDYPARAVRVSPAPLPGDAEGVTALRREGLDTPEVAITLLDKQHQPVSKAWFAVDTGGETMLHLHRSSADVWAHRDLGRNLDSGSSLSGTPRQDLTAPLRGPVSIAGVTIDRATGDIDTHHLLIGNRLLRHFRVRLDPRSQLATFTPRSGLTCITATQYGGIGINMRFRHKDRLVLTQIAADSPAARAGLLPNDKVIAIDGVAVSDPHFIDFTAWMFDPPAQVTLTIRREDDQFEVTIPTEPLFPEDLDRLRNAPPDLKPPPIHLITKPDGTMELVFPDGTRGPVTPMPNPDP